MKNVKIGKNGYIYLLDSDSKYVAHPKNAPGVEAKGPQYEYMLKNDHDFVKYVLNGDEKEAYFATNALTGWKVVGTMVTAEYDQAAAIAEQMYASSTQVAASVGEMASMTRQSTGNIQIVCATSEEQLASVQEISASSAALSAMAEQLQRMVERFKL